jgi:hypothetical protein
MTRWMHCNTGESRSGWAANRMRRGIGNESTHWRTGTRGMTQSTRCAAASAMRRAPQEGQNPRRLQEKATSFSCAQLAQRRRRNPWARMPHSRKASNSALTKSGKLAPVSAPTCAKKLSRCSCTT